MEESLIKRILRNYEQKRNRLEKEADQRRQEVYDRVPEIASIETEMKMGGIKISRAILESPLNLEEKMNNLKKHMDDLKVKKAIALTENNIPLDYMDVAYECKDCNDTGFLKSGHKCKCLKQAMIDAHYDMSNIRLSLKKENFDNFDINIFSPEPMPSEGKSQRENMQLILSICENFISEFDSENGESLLFYGGTGLGKTFLCNCIAKALLDEGYLVVYQTAFKLMEIVADHKFGRGDASLKESYNRLFDCDLLIIDDLGTEVSNSFTTSEFFNIINSRIISGKKTLISTNLSIRDISEAYTDRIFSRIFKHFIDLRFYGKDIRWNS